MSEVQTISAAVHETAHSKLHDPKKYEAEPTWKIVMVSEGGTKHDFRQDFATEAEAEQAAAEEGWRYVDENRQSRPPPRKAGGMWTKISLSGGWR